jgi:hypothetical protein
VRARMGQRRAPEVIEQQVDPRRRRIHIRIRFDCPAVGKIRK